MGRFHQLSEAGFTLVEMLLVVAIIVVITSVSVPLYQSLDNSNELDSATNILVQDLYQAQSFSRNETQDSGWGVAVNGQVITVFSGSSYATRTAANDISYTAPSSVKFGGLTQIVYSKLYGLPTATGSFTLSGGQKNSTVTINSKGMVEY